MIPTANRNDVVFDDHAAEELINIFTKIADDLDSQTTSRGTAVSDALVDFEGYFSTVFERNSTLGSNDAGQLISAFRDAAKQVGTMKESAHREQRNREKAREWEDRSVGEKFVDYFTNEQPPQDTEPEPSFSVSSPAVHQKEVPQEGSASDKGGLTSAVPQYLMDAAKTLEALDQELPTHSDLQGKLDTFETRCQWGKLDASSVVKGYRDWLESNAQENSWLKDIAGAFERAGSTSGFPVALSNDALARLVSSTGHRTDLDIFSPTVSGAMPSSGFANDPVNTATGNFIEPEQDLDFADPAGALTFTRMYNSLGAEKAGVFGPGWSSPLDSRLILDDENATWVQHDGRHVIFPRSGSAWERAAGYPLWLARKKPADVGLGTGEEDTEVLVVSDNAGAWWAFTLAGQWLAQGAGSEVTLNLRRDESGQVVGIDHRWGRSLEVDYRAGQVAYVQASDGRRVEYFYDDGLLTAVKSVSGVRRYTYNDRRLLTQVESASGTVEVQNTYDSQNRVSAQITEFGRAVRYSYIGGGITVVADTDGQNSNSWVSDHRGRLIALTDAAGNSQSMAYDTFGNRVSVTERDGSISVYAYDQRGRSSRSRLPEGADLTYAWDESDRLISIVTASGGLIEYEYEGASRNPLRVRDALGGVTVLRWDQGLLTSVTGPTGVAVQLAYNSLGELVSVTNAEGQVTRFVRDQVGRVVETVLPSGASTRFSYDAAGNLVASEDPAGAVTRCSYAAGHRLVAVTDPLGATTSFEYGPHGEIEKTIDPLGRTVTREFDAMGYVRSLGLPGGARWGFNYDTQGELVEAVDPLGSIWSYEYSRVGELSGTVDPTGVRTSRSVNRASGVETIAGAFASFSARYDAYGRLVEETAADDSRQIYTYDVAGNVVGVLDAEGGLTRIERNLAGAITAVVSPEGLRTEYGYDACGRPATLLEPSGELVTLTYDEDSRVVARTSSTGAVETFSYDVCGRVVEHRAAGGARTRLGYDRCSRLIFIADGKFGQRRFAYDAAGQLVRATNGLGGVTRFTYTGTGQVASVTEASGATTRYEYDRADRLVKQTDALGRVTRFSYDAAGRRTSVTDAAGHRHDFTYDAAGLLASRSFDGQVRQLLERDERIRTVRVSHGSGELADVHTLTYNRLGALVSHTGGGASRSWAYDRDGRRVSFTCGGVRDEYTYTPGGLLGSVTRCEGAGSSVTEQVNFIYDAAGSLLGVEDGAGSLLWGVESAPMGAPGGGGDFAAGLSADGGWAHTLTRRDAQGQLVKTTSYYNAEGLVVGLEDDRGGLRLFSYDRAHQLVAVRTAQGVHSLKYSQAGFLEQETFADGTERRYVYDAGGQLVRTVDSTGASTEFTYDALGRRVRQVGADGAACEYLWDDADRLVGLSSKARAGQAQEGQAWPVEVSYNPLGQVESVGGVSVVFDTAASLVPTAVSLAGVTVPLRTSVAGYEVTGARGLDPFAAASPIFEVGSESLAAGAPALGLGASTGLLVGGMELLGFRVYDPATRGFLSPDPLVSPVGSGWGANVYAFAGNSPVGLADPWGLSPVSRAEFAQYAQENPVGIGATAQALGNWVKDNWVGIAIIAGGIAATALLGPLGAAIVGGALLSGGFSAITNKNPDGSINWKAVGKDALFGAISGGVGSKVMGLAGKALAPQFGKIATAAGQKASRFMGKATSHAAKADDLGWWRPVSKGVHQWRAGVNQAKYAKFDAKATLWGNRADTAGDAAKFGETALGKSINGSASGATANALSYTMRLIQNSLQQPKTPTPAPPKTPDHTPQPAA